MEIGATNWFFETNATTNSFSVIYFHFFFIYRLRYRRRVYVDLLKYEWELNIARVKFRSWASIGFPWKSHEILESYSRLWSSGESRNLAIHDRDRCSIIIWVKKKSGSIFAPIWLRGHCQCPRLLLAFPRATLKKFPLTLGRACHVSRTFGRWVNCLFLFLTCLGNFFFFLLGTIER